MNRRPRPASVAFVVLVVLGVAFVAAPLIGLLARAPWARLGEVLAAPATRSALVVSVQVSLGAALTALLFGSPVAWALARGTFHGRGLVRALVVLPLVLPPVVAGVALFAAFGRNGILGRLLGDVGVTLPFTTAGAVVAGAFVAVPLFVLSVEAGLRALDRGLEDAAATLGASRQYALRRVTLPLLRPHLVAGLVLAWARALGEFGATITFAGNLRGRTQTLPLAVFETLQTDPGGATVVSLLLVAVSLGALLLLRGRILSR